MTRKLKTAKRNLLIVLFVIIGLIAPAPGFNLILDKREKADDPIESAEEGEIQVKEDKKFG